MHCCYRMTANVLFPPIYIAYPSSIRWKCINLFYTFPKNILQTHPLQILPTVISTGSYLTPSKNNLKKLHHHQKNHPSPSLKTHPLFQHPSPRKIPFNHHPPLDQNHPTIHLIKPIKAIKHQTHHPSTHQPSPITPQKKATHRVTFFLLISSLRLSNGTFRF